MENSTRKAYIADQLLGGAAKDLGPLLNSNAEDTQALKDQVHQLGGVMSDTLIDKSAAYQGFRYGFGNCVAGCQE